MSKTFHFYIVFILICCFSIGVFSCKSLKSDKRSNKKKEPINKDLFTYDELNKEYRDLIEKIGIRNGYFIADVGASLGIDDFSLSVLTDSNSYFIQDISSEIFRKKRFKQMQNYFNSIRKTPQTNKLQYVIGNERKSCLPDSSFDLIFLFNSLHEFTYVKEMLDDLSKKLKSNGRLVVRESTSTIEKRHIIDGCYTTAFTKNEVKLLMKSSGLYFNQQLYPDSNLVNIFIFDKNHR